MRALTTAMSPDQRAHDEFLRLLPTIEAHARAAFNTVRCPHDREDAVAEVIARAWERFRTAPVQFATTEGIASFTVEVRDELASSHA